MQESRYEFIMRTLREHYDREAAKEAQSAQQSPLPAPSTPESKQTTMDAKKKDKRSVASPMPNTECGQGGVEGVGSVE